MVLLSSLLSSPWNNNNKNSSCNISSSNQFLYGFACGLSLLWIIQQMFVMKQRIGTSKQHKEEVEEEEEGEEEEEEEEEDSGKAILFDSPDLDQRMIRKAEAVIQFRTSRVTIVIERCTDDHNYSAILRTAEALGIQNVWIIDPPQPQLQPSTQEGQQEEKNESSSSSNNNNKKAALKTTEEETRIRTLHHIFARNATEWLTVREFDTTAQCIEELRATGHTIWVTDLSQEAICLTKEQIIARQKTTPHHHHHHQQQQQQQQQKASLLPPKLAIVFGTEAVGCSTEMLTKSDLRVYYPLRGFADSLNLSVSTAVILQQLFLLDPTIIGDMTEPERLQLRKLWYTKLCKQRLLTAREKKERKRLKTLILQCRNVQQKQQNGQLLQPGEIEKLSRFQEYQQALSDLEGFKTTKHTTTTTNTTNTSDVITKAVQDLIDNPPRPLSDLRRADPHRVAFVSKNRKKHYEEQWKDMPAVTSYQTNTNPTIAADKNNNNSNNATDGNNSNNSNNSAQPMISNDTAGTNTTTTKNNSNDTTSNDNKTIIEGETKNHTSNRKIKVNSVSSAKFFRERVKEAAEAQDQEAAQK